MGGKSFTLSQQRWGALEPTRQHGLLCQKQDGEAGSLTHTRAGPIRPIHRTGGFCRTGVCVSGGIQRDRRRGGIGETTSHHIGGMEKSHTASIVDGASCLNGGTEQTLH
jgi:hypothetical protein